MGHSEPPTCRPPRSCGSRRSGARGTTRVLPASYPQKILISDSQSITWKVDDLRGGDSIAVIERFILNPKTHSARAIGVPLCREKMREGLGRFAGWYNESRRTEAPRPTRCTTGGIQPLATHVSNRRHIGLAAHRVPSPACPSVVAPANRWIWMSSSTPATNICRLSPCVARRRRRTPTMLVTMVICADRAIGHNLLPNCQ
jgi:hypothetical protein